MSTSTIVLTELDYRRLCSLLDQAACTTDARLCANLSRLSGELSSAQIVSPKEIPADTVTMNSRVLTTDLSDGEESEWVVTFPDQADIMEQRVSVLAPLGTALLGARKGEVVEWETPQGMGRMRIDDILYQPEAAGDFDR